MFKIFVTALRPSTSPREFSSWVAVLNVVHWGVSLSSDDEGPGVVIDFGMARLAEDEPANDVDS